MGRLSGLVDELTLQSTTFQHVHLFTSLPTEFYQMPIQVSDPCSLCYKFFVETTCVPLTCGCQVHPHCMLEGVMLRHGTCPRCNFVASGCWEHRIERIKIERMRTLLGQGCQISPTPKTTKSTFESVTRLAIAPPTCNQLCLKKGRVDPSPAKPALDSITGALVPFQQLPIPPLASHTAVESIPDFCPPSSVPTSIVTNPLSTMEAQPPFFVGGKLYVTTSTSNVSILDIISDSAATELDGGASGADLEALVVDGLDATKASTLVALVEDIVDGKCDQ